MSRPKDRNTVTKSIIIIDADICVRFVSASFLMLHNLNKKQIFGQPFYPLMSKANALSIDDFKAHVFGDDTEALEVKLLQDDRGAIPYQVSSGVQVPDPDGGLAHLALGSLDPSWPTDGESMSESARFTSTYDGSSLTYTQGVDYWTAIQHAIVRDEAFKNPRLTVTSLAKRLQTNTQYLSQVVNFFAHTSFSTYTNLKRLDALALQVAAGHLLDPTSVWKDVGFGSYSAFYRALKRHYSMSPLQFLSHG